MAGQVATMVATNPFGSLIPDESSKPPEALHIYIVTSTLSHQVIESVNEDCLCLAGNARELVLRRHHLSLMLFLVLYLTRSMRMIGV